MKLFPVWCIEDCMMHLRLLYYTFIIYHTLSNTVLSFCKKVKSDEEQEWSVDISVLQFILLVLALNTGADLQVEFPGEKKKLLLSTFVRNPDLMIWTVWQSLNLVSCSLANFLYFLKQVTFLAVLHVGIIVLSYSTCSLTQKSSWALILQRQVQEVWVDTWEFDASRNK